MDEAFEARLAQFKRDFPEVSTPYFDIRHHMVGSIVLDADVHPDGRWVTTSLDDHQPVVSFKGSRFRCKDPADRLLSVRWIGTDRVLLVDKPLGWCAIHDLDGERLHEFHAGRAVDGIAVTDRHIVFTHADELGATDCDALTGERLNVHDHEGHHLWGYRSRYDAEVDPSPILVVEAGETIGVSAREQQVLVRIDLDTGERSFLDIPVDMAQDRAPTWRGGVYYFARSPRSAFLGLFMWSPTDGVVRYLVNGGQMCDSPRRGLSGGRAVCHLMHFVFDETIPRTPYERD